MQIYAALKSSFVEVFAAPEATADGLNPFAISQTAKTSSCGKIETIQVLALLLQLRRERPAPSLLVVPASLIANWKEEIRRFAPTLAAIVIHTSEAAAAGLAALAADPEGALRGKDLVITTYGMLLRQQWFEEPGGKAVVDKSSV